jgi:hypothetical protein
MYKKHISQGEERREENHTVWSIYNIYFKACGYSPNVLQKTFPKKSYTSTLSAKR